jgi:hypothetical protein
MKMLTIERKTFCCEYQNNAVWSNKTEQRAISQLTVLQQGTLLYCSEARYSIAARHATVLQRGTLLYCSEARYCTTARHATVLQRGTLLYCSETRHCTVPHLGTAQFHTSALHSAKAWNKKGRHNQTLLFEYKM